MLQNLRLSRTRPHPVLLVRLRGGLGNQLFQYAAGRALALRNHVPLVLDTTSGFCGDPYGRSYELGAFNVLGEGVEEVSHARLGIRANLFRRFVGRRELWRMRRGQYFDPAIYNLRIKRSVALDAYCQSPRYFCEIEEPLRKELEHRATPPGLNDMAVEEIKRANSVCLHIRRLFANEADGSIRQSVGDFHGTCDIAYYRRAIHELNAVHGRLEIFVFSDDTLWAHQNAETLASGDCSVKVIDDEDPLRSFYLMRLCKHFIIANSTFSWWAAWLGRDPAKMVCVPDVWNRKERRFPSDLFPPGWRVTPAAMTTSSNKPPLMIEPAKVSPFA